MKLLHTKLARSIWLFDIRDMNPRGKAIMGDLVSWLKDAYNFSTAPDPENPVPNASPPPTTAAPRTQATLGLTFQNGSFQAEEEIYVAINNLTIYDDGIVIDAASSTEDGDKFAADLLKSASQEFALAYEPDTVRRKLHLSELVFKSDMNLGVLNTALSAFASKISDAFTNSPQPMPFVMGGVSFWSESGDGNQKVFRIERQSGRLLSENRYFSDGPFQTKAHLALLEEFERILTPEVAQPGELPTGRKVKF